MRVVFDSVEVAGGDGSSPLGCPVCVRGTRRALVCLFVCVCVFIMYVRVAAVLESCVA